MANRRKRSRGRGITTMQLIAVLVVGFLVFGGQTLTVGPGGAIIAPAEGVQLGVCDTDGTSDVSTSAVNFVADPDTLELTQSDIYLTGASNPTVAHDTSTAGANSTANAVSCGAGENFRVVFGDGTGFYHVETAETSATSAIVRFEDVEVWQVGSAKTLSFDNSTNLGAASVYVTLGTGEDDTSITMEVAEGTSDSYYGIPGQQFNFAACFSYNTGNFTGVELIASGDIATVAEIETPKSSATNYQECWGAKTNNDLVDFKKVDATILIDTVAGVNPGLAGGSNITIEIFDWASYIDDGVIKYDIENRDTNAVIGAADVSTTSAIRVI